MKKVTVNLPDEIHQHLQKQASLNHTSITQLVRDAIVYVYREDIEDIQSMEKAMAEYKADPSTAITVDELRWQRQANR